MTHLVCVLVGAFISLAQPAWAQDVYSWSENRVVDPPAGSRQQGETALVADARGRVWLSFIDAEYRQAATGKWLAWPRKVRLFVSNDAGITFSRQPDLAEEGGDQAVTADLDNGPYATYVHYFYDAQRRIQQRIALKNLVTGEEPNEGCLPWDNNTRHDQSSAHIDRNGVVHVVGVDITAPSQSKQPRLLYARSTDGGKTCIDQRRIDEVGQLPQVADMDSGLLIVGPLGYYVSSDHGSTFPDKINRRFGDKLARLALSPDRRTAYVVGDSRSGGLYLHVSSDGGKTWRKVRVDDAPKASAWRYPAIHVDARGRVHVVWMDDRTGFGALYHAWSDDSGRTFSPSTRVSNKPYQFPADAPPPPPATQDGTWIGDYLSLTTTGNQVVVAWSDQREKAPRSVVYVAVGEVRTVNNHSP